MSSRILCIGDVHGEWLCLNKIIEKINNKEYGHLDAAFQLGDFGMYPELIDQFKYNVDAVRIPFYILEGNHEVPECYPQYKGIFATRNMSLVERGEYFQEFKMLCIGGASHAPWERNLPFRLKEKTEITQQDIRKCLTHTKKDVDIILSHDAPQRFFENEKINEQHRMQGQPGDTLFNYLIDELDPFLWVFAHHHQSFNAILYDISFVGLAELEEKVIEI